MQNTSLDPFGIVRRQSSVLQQAVGNGESNTGDIMCRTQRVGVQGVDGFFTIFFEDSASECRIDAVVVQVVHQILQAAVRFPGRGQPGGSVGSNSLNFCQTFRTVGDHFEGFFAKMIHQQCGSFGSQPFDHPRSQCCPNSIDRCRHYALSGDDPQLLPIAGMIFPASVDLQDCTRVRVG